MAKQKPQEHDGDPRIQKIAARIKSLRKAKGYTSAETFSYDHSINRILYWRLESGVNFTISSLFKVLDAHDMTLKEFFEGVKEHE